ncbi:hypothetical protein BX616_004751 [Lobosporangium transversale]|nr:hypothetical protein BX616_004751 [Lobosporangium transversale]
MQCAANGHQIIALGNLYPTPQDKRDELDSYMYQTVGHDVIHLYKDCLDLPLYRQEIKGTPIEQRSDYIVTAEDETEDLFELLSRVKTAHPGLEAVSVGAILSNYQRIRVENVCARLGLVTLAYLWQRDQEELLHEMVEAGVNAILIKIAAIGLKRQHLGQSIKDMLPYLCRMNQEYDLHICGEGGEYETVTLDCPLFKRRIIVDESEVAIHSDDHFAQVAYLRFKKLHVEAKYEDDMNSSWIADMNLRPLWSADSIMRPIEDIVSSKLPLKDTFTESKRASQCPKKSDVPHSIGINCRPDSTVHQNKIVYAIGGTTAYDSPLSNDKVYLNIAEETAVCLQNVQAKLERIGLSWEEVVFMQVFVSNMGDFGIVNSVYKVFFDINPPPRACVGANLPSPVRIQVSCTAIHKNATSPKPRQTLHVQGISYWAPANIGPYSQVTEQAYHAFIAGQIGMIPNTLDLPAPSSLVKEVAWSLRNLSQIAALRQLDLANRTALCIAYVRHADNFVAVTAAWEYIANKQINPAPLLVVCVPTLPKDAQVEWQVVLHHGKVYAEKITKAATGPTEEGQDGYETDDDDMHQLEKRALQPRAFSFNITNDTHSRWRTSVQSWFLSPILMALSTIQFSDTSLLTSKLSLNVTSELTERDSLIIVEMMKTMVGTAIKAMDKVLRDHPTSAVDGPGIADGWGDVVGITVYYLDILIHKACQFEEIVCELLSQYFPLVMTQTNGNIAITVIPVQAIANHGVIALTLHAVGRMPTIPSLLQ